MTTDQSGWVVGRAEGEGKGLPYLAHSCFTQQDQLHAAAGLGGRCVRHQSEEETSTVVGIGRVMGDGVCLSCSG